MPKLSVLHRNLWDDPSLPWTEEMMQIAVVEKLHKREKLGGFTFAADQNGMRSSKRTGQKAKLAGMRAGEADLRFYLNDGRLGMIEMKTKKNSVSKHQKERHKLLKSLGHDVRVVKAGCPQEAIDKVFAILDEWIA